MAVSEQEMAVSDMNPVYPHLALIFHAADSLGGDLAWALGVSVFAPCPTKKEWPVRLHGFLNTGRVVGWESGEPLSHI